jgi:hypothetical protein
MTGARDSWIAIWNERDTVIRRRRRLQDRITAFAGSMTFVRLEASPTS